MRWEDERYVRLYTRDTPDWLDLPWEARAVFYEMLRKVDRAGLMPIGKSGHKGLARLLNMPAPIVDRGLTALLEDGCIVRSGDWLLLANFVAAQEAGHTDKTRQRESRERARDKARAAAEKLNDSEKGTSQHVTDGHGKSPSATNGHGPSQPVTLTIAQTRSEEPPIVPRSGDTDEPEPPTRAQKRDRRKPGRQIPDGWTPSDAHREQAANLGLDVDAQARRFRNHAEANDRRLCDWNAGFRNWLEGAPAYDRRPAAPTAEQPLKLRPVIRREPPPAVDPASIDPTELALWRRREPAQPEETPE